MGGRRRRRHLLHGGAVNPANNSQKDDSPLQLRRLDLKSRRWLAAAAGNRGKAERMLRRNPRGSPTTSAFAVLTSRGPANGPATQNRLLYFVNGNSKPLWSYAFSGSGSIPDPGVRLWAANMPDFSSSDLVPLSWLDDGIRSAPVEQADIVNFGRHRQYPLESVVHRRISTRVYRPERVDALRRSLWFRLGGHEDNSRARR